MAGGMIWEPGVTVIKGYRTQACKKISLVPEIGAGVIPRMVGASLSTAVH